MSWSAWLSWWTWHSRSLASRHCERVAVRVVCPFVAINGRSPARPTTPYPARAVSRLTQTRLLDVFERDSGPTTASSPKDVAITPPAGRLALNNLGHAQKAVRLECKSGITITLLTVLRTDSRPIFLPTHSRLAQSRCRSVSRVSPPRGTLPPVLHPLGPGTASRPLRTASVHAMQTIKCVVRPPRLRFGPRRVARPRIRTSGPPPRSASVAPLCRDRALSRRIRSRSCNAGLSCTSR